MVDWATLVKNRTPAVSVTNSAHMLECMKTVQEKYPNAQIAEVPKEGWQLKDGDTAMSEINNSHYACWAEVAEAMRESS
jgi:hypothetical protein